MEARQTGKTKEGGFQGGDKNLWANKEFPYAEGEVIYVQNLRVLDTRNVLSQFQKLNYLKKNRTQNNETTKTKTQSPSLVTVYSFKKNPFPVN